MNSATFCSQVCPPFVEPLGGAQNRPLSRPEEGGLLFSREQMGTWEVTALRFRGHTGS